MAGGAARGAGWTHGGRAWLRSRPSWAVRRVKFTRYFEAIRTRPDRAIIRLEWIEHVIQHPEREVIQADGRIRRWAPVPDMEGRHLRVVLLADGETVHNAFFDRSFTP